jgi:hypothetical protein
MALTAGVVFESTHPFLFFDYFRIPYRVVARGSEPTGRAGGPDDVWGCIRRADSDGGPPGLLAWPRMLGGPAELVRSLAWGSFRLDGIPIFGHVLTDASIPGWLAHGGRWRPAEPITSGAGEQAASLWRDAQGNLVLPFDPGEVLQNYWSERYTRTQRSSATGLLRAAMLRAYYSLRPALPRSVQLRIRRTAARRQRPPSFPRWPMETAPLELCDWLFEQVARFAGRPVPWLAPWPAGFDWALLLTHDVETAHGWSNIALLRDVEREHGSRSSWNFVPLRYEVDFHVLRQLVEEGCEIGVHGLRHDGRDLGSRRAFLARLPAIRAYRAEWGAVGFRAPATQRDWEWIRALGFDYDSSYPDTDPYEPQPGGCCSCFPYVNGSTVELPITMPQDHTLFTILGATDETVWIEKVRHIRSWGGMALFLVHPDYAGDRRIAEAYRRVLQTFRDDPTVWQALPREVSGWWRRRAASSLEAVDGGWAIRGPAAGEGRIRFAVPGASALRTAGHSAPPAAVVASEGRGERCAW